MIATRRNIILCEFRALVPFIVIMTSFLASDMDCRPYLPVGVEYFANAVTDISSVFRAYCTVASCSSLTWVIHVPEMNDSGSSSHSPHGQFCYALAVRG